MNEIRDILAKFRLIAGEAGEMPDGLRGVTNDSRKVEKGFVFVAIPGAKLDGNDYLDNAAAKGAKLLIHTRDYVSRDGICTIKVTDAYYAYALLCEYFQGYPARRFRLHCITGTNGKTTTAYLLWKMLNSCGHPCGLISTIKYAYADLERDADRTTPEAGELQKIFREMADYGCTDVVMEVSSHGMSQHRLGSAPVETAIFTNLTQDHLDYHGTMENYYQAKKILFTEYQVKNKIINTDDPYGGRLAGEIPGAMTFGQNPAAGYVISNTKLEADGSTYTLNKSTIQIHLPGEHNLYNLTGALIAAECTGVYFAEALAAVKDIRVDGRLEHYMIEGADYYIDYAHTPDALYRVLKLLKKITAKRLITVFGCGGNRDISKRSQMGRIAEELSDIVILTSDNPRDEEPPAIIKDIRSGAPSALIEPDRRRAIAIARQMAEPGDTVLIAGTGHETYQEIKGIREYFSDRDELLNI